MPCGYEALRTTGVRIWYQVSHRACAEVSAALEVSRWPVQRSQQLQNMTILIVNLVASWMHPPSLQPHSGACDNTLAESQSTMHTSRGGWEHLEVVGSCGEGHRSDWEVCIWLPDWIIFCTFKSVTHLMNWKCSGCPSRRGACARSQSVRKSFFSVPVHSCTRVNMSPNWHRTELGGIMANRSSIWYTPFSWPLISFRKPTIHSQVWSWNKPFSSCFNYSIFIQIYIYHLGLASAKFGQSEDFHSPTCWVAFACKYRHCWRWQQLGLSAKLGMSSGDILHRGHLPFCAIAFVHCSG